MSLSLALPSSPPLSEGSSDKLLPSSVGKEPHDGHNTPVNDEDYQRVACEWTTATHRLC